MSNFVERLEELLFERNLNQKKFADALNISETAVTHYLQGKHVPTLKIFVAIADFFGCSTDFLLGLEEQNFHLTFKPCPPFSKQLAFLKEHFQRRDHEIYRNPKKPKDNKVSKSCYYDWLSGTRIPTIENVIRLADLFDCRVDFVLGRES